MSATVAPGAGEPVAAAPSSGPVTIHVIWVSVLIGTLFVAGGVARFLVWLSRRRADRHALPDLTGEGAIHTVVSREDASPKKLRKVAWSTTKSRIVSSSSSSSSSSTWYSLPARLHRSLPILSRLSTSWTGRLSFVSSLSKRSSGQPKHTPSTRHRRNASWIDEDAIHGPATFCNPPELGSTGKGKEGARESWPMQNRSPTLPRLCHSLYGGYEQQWQEKIEKDTMTGAVGLYPSSPDSYTQVAMEARSLPEPPQPAVVASRDRPAAPLPPPVRMGHRYSNSEPPMRPKANLGSSPVKSPPRTPSRQRKRQSSTDSTLSEILRSTEKRLQEGYVGSSRLPKRSRTSAAALGKSQWFGTSRESLLDHRQYGGVDEPPPVAVQRSRSEAKPSSPKKVTISLDNGGHSRQNSQTSTVSSCSSIELGTMRDFVPGLVNFNRNSELQEPETQFLGIQSVRSSVSSALSTIQSEDEVPESVKASSPLSSPTSNLRLQSSRPVDPFSSAAWAAVPHRPPTAHVHQPRTQRPPDLFRESLERSLRTSILRSAVDQSALLAEANKLPPLPAAPGGAKPHSFFRGDCPGCCKLGETKTIPVQTWAGGSIPGSAAIELPTPSRGELVAPPARGPKGPRSLSSTKTNVLNSIVLPPPPSAPNFIGINGQPREQVPAAAVIYAEPANDDDRPRAGSRSPFDRDNSPPSPTRRASSRASRVQPRTSVSSSVYSQDPKELPATSTVNANASANMASFQANSRINTSTTIPFRTVLKATSSSENMRLPKFTGFINDLKDANSDVGDRENNRDNGRPPSSLGFGIASTVAELRRMNSGISVATSLASTECGGYGSDNRPTTPTARLSGIAKSNHRKSGRGSDSGMKAYLSLGGTTPTSLQEKNRESKALSTISGTSSTDSPTPRRRSGLASSSSIPVPAVVELTISPATPSSGSPIKKKRKTITDSDDIRPAWKRSSGLMLGRQSQQHDKYQFDDQAKSDLDEQDQQGGEKGNNSKTNTNPTHRRNNNTTASEKLPPPSFKFPPAPTSLPVPPTEFTFPPRPLPVPIQTPTKSSTSPSIKTHRRHNSSTNMIMITTKPNPKPQWGPPINPPRIRDRSLSPTRTTSPPKTPLPLPVVVPAPLAIPSKSPRRAQFPVFEKFGGGGGDGNGDGRQPKTPEAVAAGVGVGAGAGAGGGKDKVGMVTETPGRRSVESLGLYDQDGFLITSPAPAGVGLGSRSPVRCR